jgi:hypothetical protein
VGEEEMPAWVHAITRSTRARRRAEDVDHRGAVVEVDDCRHSSSGGDQLGLRVIADQRTHLVPMLQHQPSHHPFNHMIE